MKEEEEERGLTMARELDCMRTIVSFLVRFFHVLRKFIFMVISSKTSSPPSSPFSWKLFVDTLILDLKKERDVSKKRDEDFTPQEPVPEKVFVSKAGERSPVGAKKMRIKLARIEIPQREVVESEVGEAFCPIDEGSEREIEVEGSGYFLAARRGDRHRMEDGYGVMTDIHGDSKQAFFGVFDGHGGKDAMDFTSDKLGKNILSALEMVQGENDEVKFESAIRLGYLNTDQEFLNKGLSSGTCAATVFLRNGELYASNVGDCRVVMSRKGVAHALTTDHRPGRKDEMIRIENSGGFLLCHHGVWRVDGSLAISRAIGDARMKKWIISEPETKRIQLNQDCEFLIIASDGLWDKVENQEAVDAVARHSNWMQSCKDLIDMSCRRGNLDDMTVLVVDLPRFCAIE